MAHTAPFTLSLFGALQAFDAEGAPVKVTGKRARALLGLLALAPSQGRDRVFLQEMLWPDRFVEQAQTSLRQEIARLRRVFGLRDVLEAEGSHLKLNADAIQVDLVAEQRAQETAAAPAHFLEGIDIDGPFEDWLREARLRLAAQARASARSHAVAPISLVPHRIVLGLSANATNAASLAGDVFLDRVARSVSELGPVDVVRAKGADLPEAADLQLEQAASAVPGGTLLRHALLTPRSGRVSWTSEWSGTDGELWDDAVLRTGFMAQQAVLETLQSETDTPDDVRRGLSAILDGFSLDPARMRNASRVFGEVSLTVPHTAFLAWRAFVITNQIVERQLPNPEAAADEASALAREALAQASQNSIVLAIAAHVLRILDDNAAMASELAQDAVRINPANPLAWSSAANALISLGRPEEAFPLAQRALAISRNSPFRFWWEMNACVAAVMVGDTESGVQHARMAHWLKPQFRPPLRYLCAIHLAQDNAPGALAMAEKLRKLEPDFEIRLFSEPEYPAGTLRKSATFEQIKKIDLAALQV